MFKIRNIKTFLFESFEHLDFGFVSDFDIRISNLFNSRFILVLAAPG